MAPLHRLLTEARFDHTGVRREFTGQDAGMNIGATLAQTAQEGGAGIARRSDVYIALVGEPLGASFRPPATFCYSKRVLSVK
jgi:hypothetical protein